jgi:hypothetical protein
MLLESKTAVSGIDIVYILYIDVQEGIFQGSLVFQSPEDRSRNVHRRENMRSRDQEW